MDRFSMVVLNGIPDDDTRAVIIIPPEYYDQTYNALDAIYERYYDSEDENYYYWGWGDYIEDELMNAGIVYSILYIEDFEALLNANESNDVTDFGDHLYSNYLEYVEKNMEKVITRT